MQPVAVLVNCQHLALPRRRFGGRAVEGTAPVLRKRYVVSERIEECQDLVRRIVDTGLGLLDPLAESFVAPTKIRRDHLVLPPENVVQRAFCDSRLLDNGVNSGGMHTVAIEQFVASASAYQTELSEKCCHVLTPSPLSWAFCTPANVTR